MVDGVVDIAFEIHHAVFQHDARVAKVAHACHVVAHEEHGAAAALAHLFHFSDGLLLELRVAHGEHFVHNQYLGFKECGDGEP